MLLIIPSIKLILLNTHLVVSFPREHAYICLQNIYLSIEFEVLKQDNSRYVDNDQICLVNFGPIALFSEAKLAISSGKHLEKVDNFHAVYLL